MTITSDIRRTGNPSEQPRPLPSPRPASSKSSDMKRHLRLLLLYFAQYAKVRMGYKADFFIAVFSSMAATVLGFGFVLVLFSKIPRLQDWSFYEVLFLYGFSLIPLGFFAMVAFIVYVIVDTGRRRHLQASEFHARILEKAGSAQELGLLLNSEGGAKLLASLAAPRASGTSVYSRILRAVQTGLVLLSLGVGLFMIGWWNPLLPPRGHAVLNIFGGNACNSDFRKMRI